MVNHIFMHLRMLCILADPCPKDAIYAHLVPACLHG